MHESFRSLRPGWILLSWVVAAALTSLLLVALDVVGGVSVDNPAQNRAVSAAVLAGFALGGFLLGTRANAAPTLHGLALGLVSAVVFVGVNLLGEMVGTTSWGALGYTGSGVLLVLQVASAVIGARAGVRWARRR